MLRVMNRVHPSRVVWGGVLLALTLFAAPGCSFLADRGHDAAQMLGFSAGPALGTQVNVRATKLVQLGWGSYQGSRYGLIEGRLTSQEEIRSEFGAGPLYLHEVETSPAVGSGVVGFARLGLFDPGYEEYSLEIFDFTDRGLFDVGASFNLFFFGMDVQVKPAEIADFLTGLFYVDLLGDDVYRYELREHLLELRSASAGTRSRAVRALRLRTGQEFGYLNFNDRDVRPEIQRKAIEDWELHFPVPSSEQTQGSSEPAEAGSMPSNGEE